VTLAIFLVGFALVALGHWMRERRTAKSAFAAIAG